MTEAAQTDLIDQTGTDVANAPEQRQPATVSDSGSIMEVISRAARDPDTDVDKLERLMAMYERLEANKAKAAYMAALAEMQPMLPVIEEHGAIRDRSGKVQSTYALWEDINEAIRPILAGHGFALSFKIGETPEGKIVVTGILSHRDGHSEETTLPLPHDGSGSKNAVQGVGSSTSYGKRYTAQALLNLTSRGEDDDGQSGGAGPVITADQREDLENLLSEVGADIPKFCKYLRIDSLASLPAHRWQEALAVANKKRKQAKENA